MVMSRTEALEKYGARQVKFASYYKYSFTFTGEDLEVTVGGNKDDIYRFSVDTEEVAVSDLMEGEPVCIREGDKVVYEERW